MAIDLGDPYPLSINIYDANGNLANAGSVSLTVNLPDGTVNSIGVVAPTSTGVYTYDYTTIQVGKHNARWVATGANASAHTSNFYVNPTDTGEFISLPHFKSYIRKTKTDNDDLIRTFIAASCAVINDRCGQIAPMTFVEDLKASTNGYVRLLHWPVISITSVQSIPGLATLTQYNTTTGAPGWNLEHPYLPLYIGGVGTYRVTYRAGLMVIPQNFILGALELSKHLWQSSQNNTGGGRPTVGTDEMVVNGVSYAMPYNVRQLLGLDKRPRSDVFVG